MRRASSRDCLKVFETRPRTADPTAASADRPRFRGGYVGTGRFLFSLCHRLLFSSDFTAPCPVADNLTFAADWVGSRFTPVRGRAALFARVGPAVVLFLVVIGRVSVSCIQRMRNFSLNI